MIINEKLTNHIPDKYIERRFQRSIIPSSNENIDLLKSTLQMKNFSHIFHNKYNINTLHNPHVNIINGDLLQIYSDMRILSNREILESNNPMFNLYSIKSLDNEEMNSYEYGELVKKHIIPGKLNIIEGGCSFYLYYLRTIVFADQDVKSMFLYYDTSIMGGHLRRRAEVMFLEGAFEEFLRVEKLKKSILKDSTENDESNTRNTI